LLCIEARGYAVYRLNAEYTWTGTLAWVTLTPLPSP
jgi:hypothetical protein